MHICHYTRARICILAIASELTGVFLKMTVMKWYNCFILLKQYLYINFLTLEKSGYWKKQRMNYSFSSLNSDSKNEIIWRHTPCLFTAMTQQWSSYAPWKVRSPSNQNRGGETEEENWKKWKNFICERRIILRWSGSKQSLKSIIVSTPFILQPQLAVHVCRRSCRPCLAKRIRQLEVVI